MTMALTVTPTVSSLNLDIIAMKYVSWEEQLVPEAKHTTKALQISQTAYFVTTETFSSEQRRSNRGTRPLGVHWKGWLFVVSVPWRSEAYKYTNQICGSIVWIAANFQEVAPNCTQCTKALWMDTNNRVTYHCTQLNYLPPHPCFLTKHILCSLPTFNCVTALPICSRNPASFQILPLRSSKHSQNTVHSPFTGRWGWLLSIVQYAKTSLNAMVAELFLPWLWVSPRGINWKASQSKPILVVGAVKLLI